MTWIKFIIWLCGIYSFYYAALIVWDLLRNGKSPLKTVTNQLTFVEHIEPIKPLPEPANELSPSAVVSSGGVNLKQLFNLCREEAVEFTRAVSF